MNQLVWIWLCGCLVYSQSTPEPYLQAAKKTALWLEAQAIKTPHGLTWAADPSQPQQRPTHLYSGSSGVVLFFLNLADETQNEQYQKLAIAGGDELLASLPQTLNHPAETSLYVGTGGIGFVLDRLFEVTQEKRFREGTQQVVTQLVEAIAKVNAGGSFGQVTDIVSGQAGMGIFLLDAYLRLKRSDALLAATRIADMLMAQKEAKQHGWSWPMSPGFEREMPNFSHGTAGVAFFLAKLHAVTKNKAYLEAALRGGTYVQHLSNDKGLVYHHAPGGEQLYYLGWCHGPPGTSRLFQQLWYETGDATWLKHANTGMAGLLEMDLPNQTTPGFWNNVGICCGSAGVCSAALERHQHTNKEAFLTLAKQLADTIVSRASQENKGLKWVHAEHRTRPQQLAAQTGYMQGAAGIGILMIDLHRYLNGKPKRFPLPDMPHKFKSDG